MHERCGNINGNWVGNGDESSAAVQALISDDESAIMEVRKLISPSEDKDENEESVRE